MNKILLVSEKYIKEQSNLNDNIFGEYLLPAIREAQDMGLQTIVGECLYKKLLNMVEDGTIVEDMNKAYKDLLDNYVQDYLMYQTISDLVPIIGTKLANLGTVISNDEHVQNLTESERERIRAHYEYRADFYCRRMQEFLLNNKEAFKELDCCTCNKIENNLKSAASTGLWLGGLRAKRK